MHDYDRFPANRKIAICNAELSEIDSFKKAPRVIVFIPDYYCFLFSY